ncbi:hypothetical protein [Fuscibacter oryzae]|uniref:Uncharacterized protein n=1 Tax=Fuscibacter oryzae TaxID=2803939 RepID=A0A8J7MPT6_9RHOB|nr:hypothetical protein [Fuscibacter oryzae]MBL4927523.1 hypothetical protein [Fuscibacter oryzae]
MTYDETRAGMRPLPSIDSVLAAHGAGKVLAAAVVALLRGRFRKARPPDLRDLNAHLLRDIGAHGLILQPRDPLL